MNKPLILIAAAFIFVLSACDNDQTSRLGRSDIKKLNHACDLLTPDDVQQTIGKPVALGKHYIDYDCTYEVAKQDSDSTTQQHIFLRTTLPAFNMNPGEALSAHNAGMKEGLGEDGDSYQTTAVPDIGDLAEWETFPGIEDSIVLLIFRSVNVQGKSGTVMVTVQLTGFVPESGRQYAKSLGLKAVENI